MGEEGRSFNGKKGGRLLIYVCLVQRREGRERG